MALAPTCISYDVAPPVPLAGADEHAREHVRTVLPAGRGTLYFRCPIPPRHPGNPCKDDRPRTECASGACVCVCVCRAVRASMRCVPVRGMCEVSAMLFRRRRIDVLEEELATQKERNLSAGAFVTSSCIATKEMTCR